MASMEVNLQRVYVESAPGPGKRVLVDRLWPRGEKRDVLKPDLWLRDLGPSNELRKWFGHRAERWPEFQRRYRKELQQPPQRELLSQLSELALQGPLTLLYSARDEQHNQALVLRSLLEEAAGT
jgi:uncharacterized protein YeaO (DUF488 family)